ncbi:hypothetical protein F4818DRAFT_436890 [Hypoxylon cercidicola]|nr:hypothetical protein F4818DRAFT_436890 [Hypoxylon cercidicola]
MTFASSVNAFFDRYYRNVHQSRRALMASPDIDYINRYIEFDAGTVDMRIAMAGDTSRHWDLHSDVVIKYSNFFRMALSGKFADLTTLHIPVHPDIMSFIVTWMYNGWDYDSLKAVNLHREPESERKSETVIAARILLAADYLDMPQLCYDCYEAIIYRLVRLIMSADDPQFAHDLIVKQQPFVEAADVLRNSGARLVNEFAHGITDLLQDLARPNPSLNGAARDFVRIFPHEALILYREMSW